MTHSDSYFSLSKRQGPSSSKTIFVAERDFFGWWCRKMSIPSRALPIVTSPPFYVLRNTKGFMPCGNASKGKSKNPERKESFSSFTNIVETHFFDYPDLKQALESKGIPTLLLEVEDHPIRSTIEDSCSGICRNVWVLLACEFRNPPHPTSPRGERGRVRGNILNPNPHSAFRHFMRMKIMSEIIPKPILTGK